MKCQVDAIQWGGVVAEFFCGPEADAIQWGGGSSFSVPSKSRRDSVGGGVVPGIFR